MASSSLMGRQSYLIAHGYRFGDKEGASREASMERPTTAMAATATSNITTTIIIAEIWQQRSHFALGSGRGKLKTVGPQPRWHYGTDCEEGGNTHNNTNNHGIHGGRRWFLISPFSNHVQSDFAAAKCLLSFLLSLC